MLINPSKGTTLKLDNTICNIMNYCAENKYGSFRLVNLFPIMATSTKELSGRLSEGQQDNDTCIRDSLIWADTIYIAWGSDQKKYINRKRTVENMIFEYAPDKDKLCWVDLENKYPRHLRIIEEGWALKQYRRQFKECT